MELSLSVRPAFKRSATRQSRLSHMADAAEMESLAIMRLLSHESTPVAAVRVVSDGEERGVPFDFECALDSLGQLQLWRLFPQPPAAPGVLPDLIRSRLTSCRATMILARCFDHCVERLTQDIAYGSSRRQG